MRTTALPSMLDILARNYAYHNKAVKLYELAKIYLPVDGQTLPDEPKRAGPRHLRRATRTSSP